MHNYSSNPVIHVKHGIHYKIQMLSVQINTKMLELNFSFIRKHTIQKIISVCFTSFEELYNHIELMDLRSLKIHWGFFQNGLLKLTTTCILTFVLTALCHVRSHIVTTEYLYLISLHFKLSRNKESFNRVI